MDRREKTGAGALGIDIMTGAAIAASPQPWLYVLFTLGAVVALWGFWGAISAYVARFGRLPWRKQLLSAAWIIGGLILLVGGAGAIRHGISFFLPSETKTVANMKDEAEKLGPTFQAETGGQIITKGAVLAIDPIKLGRFAKATTGGTIDMSGMMVTDMSAPTVFPRATDEFSSLSNAELIAKGADISARLREVQREYDGEMKKIPMSDMRAWNEEMKKLKARYDEIGRRQAVSALSITAELLKRLGGKVSGEGVSGNIKTGGNVVLYGQYGGQGMASDAADFLDFLCTKLQKS